MVHAAKTGKVVITDFNDTIERTEQSIDEFYIRKGLPSEKLLCLVAAMTYGDDVTVKELWDRVNKEGARARDITDSIRSLIEGGYLTTEDPTTFLYPITKVKIQSMPKDMLVKDYKDTIGLLEGISKTDKREYYNRLRHQSPPENAAPVTIGQTTDYTAAEAVDLFFELAFKEPPKNSDPSKRTKHYSEILPMLWQSVVFLAFYEQLKQGGSVRPKDIKVYGYDAIHIMSATEKGYLKPHPTRKCAYTVAYRFTDDKEKMMRFAAYILKQQDKILSEEHAKKIGILADKILELPAGTESLENNQKGDKWTIRHAALLLAFAEQCEDMTPPDENGRRHEKTIKNTFHRNNLNTGKVNKRPVIQALEEMQALGYIADVPEGQDLYHVVACPVRMGDDGKLRKMTREELMEGFALVLPEMFKGSAEHTEEYKERMRVNNRNQCQVGKKPL